MTQYRRSNSRRLRNEGRPRILATGPYLAISLAGLGATYALTVGTDGRAGLVVHLLYVPVLLVAYRFGPLPTLLISLVAGGITSPVMPPHVAHELGLVGPSALWVERSCDFVVLGQVAALLFRSLRRQRDAAAQASIHDPLTGLCNRVLFFDRLDRSLSGLQRSGGTVGLLFVDLDDFKAVNDHHGHGVGDQLLKQVGERLQERVRTGETVARISGDEFAVIVEGERPGASAFVAERVLGALQPPFLIGDHRFDVHASVGVAEAVGHAVAASELLRRADEAMYMAKRSGKNRVHVLANAAPVPPDERSAKRRSRMVVDLGVRKPKPRITGTVAPG